MLEFTTLHARMAAATAITLVSRAASDTFPCSCETIRDGSHILSEIQPNCTRAAIIREGQVIACDSVEALSRTTARRVSVRGEVSLEGLGGIRDREDSPGAVSFLYSGDMNLLLQRLAAGRVSDLSVSEPDLEEIFMHYYES